MSGIKTPGRARRVAVLTSLFCLVSLNQRAQAWQDRAGWAPDRPARVHHHTRQDPGQNFQAGTAGSGGDKREPRINSFVHVPRVSGTVFDTTRSARKLDIDLTSTQSKIILGAKLFGSSDSVSINVGGEKRTYHAGEQVTAGQYVAIRQVLEDGSQSLVLDSAGSAASGSFSLNSVAGPKINNLVISAGVTGTDDFARGRQVSVRGDLTNFGSIVGFSSNDKIDSGVLSGKNINNEAGASISTDLSLTLWAQERVQNAGDINSSGSLSIQTGSGVLINSGSIATAAGDLNVSSSNAASTIDIQAAGGSFAALAGNISIRDVAYAGNGGVNMRGGDYLSNNLNIYSGSGNVDGIVGNVTGKLNTVAGVEHFYAAGDILKVGNNCVTGDPTFANSAGSIQIQGLNTFGESVAFLASGDISADNTAQIATNGFNVYMVAGTAINVSSGPETTAVPGAQIGAATTATVNFGAGNGGSIDLTSSAAGAIIDTSSTTGAGGNVVLAALANGTTGGAVRLSSTSTINTSSTFAGADAGNLSIFAGANPASPSTTIQLGNVTSVAGAGGGGGNVSINNSQPTATGGTSVTFDSTGQISAGGPIIAGTVSANGQTSVAGITASGDITISTTALHNTGSVATSKAGGKISVLSATGLMLDGAGTMSLNGGGNGQIVLDTEGANVLALGSSLTFNPGATGSLTITSEDEGGSISIAPAAAITINDGGTINIGTTLLSFLGAGSSITATGASPYFFSSGGSLNPLTIASPDNASATISTAGGTIDITPTSGFDLVFTNLGSLGLSTLNLLGGAVSTNTDGATTVVNNLVRVNSDNVLTMTASGAGGISGLAFQPYVGGFVPQGGTTFFNGYDLNTVKALLQQLKTDGFTEVSTYSQGSFYFNNQFFGPTTSGAGSNKLIIQAAHELGMTVSAGVFQQGMSGDSFNINDTLQEVNYILQQAQTFPGTVKEIILLNESIVGPNSLDQLISLIGTVKTLRDNTPVTPGSNTHFTAATLPITTRQKWGVLAGVNNNSYPLQAKMKQLLNAVEDHVYANMYAYFDSSIGTGFSPAPQDQDAYTTAVTTSMTNQMNALKTAFSAQGITAQARLGETGWPTDGLRAPGDDNLPPAPALANVTLAKWYFLAMKNWTTSQNVPTYIFQGYDQPWQTVPAAQVPTTPGSSEGFFGLYTAVGTSTQASFTLTSITSKFGSGVFGTSAVGTGGQMISNQGQITANNIVMNTPHLDNTGTISAVHALGSVAVSSSTDFDLTGSGTINRTGGGTGSISLTALGASDLEIHGFQSFDAGAGNTVSFNATGSGGSVTLAQGATINLPTNNTAATINTEHFLRNGIIDSHAGTNPNTTVSFSSAGDATVACSTGSLDISGMSLNVGTGHLALLSAGDIINSGAATTLNLSTAGQGGSLLLIAGHSFTEVTLGTDDPLYVLDSTSNSTGAVVFNAAGHEVSINTSGATGGGNVEVYANGAVGIKDINTQGGTGASGNVTIKGLGVTVGQIDTTNLTPSASALVEIQSGAVVHSGVNVLCGTMDSGVFSINSHSGNVQVGDITTAKGSILIQTDGAASSIGFASALPTGHNLSLLAGTGVLNLPTNTIAVAQDTAGNGGTVSISAADFGGVTLPLVMLAVGTGTGNGGSISYRNMNIADLVIDSSLLQANATGVNGGSVTVAGGGNLVFDPLGVVSAGPTGGNGNGVSIGAFAGVNGPGNLVVLGPINADANGNGTGGTVSLGSNSTNTFEVSSSKTKNGVQGLVSFAGGAPGSLSVSNAGGAISILQEFPTGFNNLTLDTTGATKGNISVKRAPTATGAITMIADGNGKISTKLISAPSVTLSTDAKSLKADVDAATLIVNSNAGVNVKAGATALTLVNSGSEEDFMIKSDGSIAVNNVTVNNGSLYIASAGQLSTGVGALVSANSNSRPGTGTITLKGDGKASSIVLGAGSTIATSGVGGGDVSIFVWNKPKKTNALPPGTTGNLFVSTSGGGEVFADTTTFVANGPANNLNAIGKNVLISGGKTGALTIDGGVTVTADPPPVTQVTQKADAQQPTVSPTLSQTTVAPTAEVYKEPGAMTSYGLAQAYERMKQPSKAIECYEEAIQRIRTGSLPYDKRFKMLVATKYARLLKKQNDSNKARTIEKEFCGKQIAQSKL